MFHGIRAYCFNTLQALSFAPAKGFLIASALIGLLSASALPAQARDGISLFNVTRVNQDDVLNIRATPDPESDKVGQIPANGQGIEATGGSMSHNGYIWREVRFNNVTGWVNGYFLIRATKPQAGTTGSTSKPKGRVFPEAISCAGTEPFWGVLIRDYLTVFDSLSEGRLELRMEPARPSTQNQSVWAIDAEVVSTRRPVTALIRKVNQCSDGMSDVKYPYEIQIIMKNGPVYSGCCRQADKR